MATQYPHPTGYFITGPALPGLALISLLYTVKGRRLTSGTLLKEVQTLQGGHLYLLPSATQPAWSQPSFLHEEPAGKSSLQQWESALTFILLTQGLRRVELR